MSGQSRKGKRQKKQPAKRGPKAGHTSTSRTQAEPDVVLELRVEQCGACGADRREVEQPVIGSSQVVDLPPMRPVVIEARRCAAHCPACGHEPAAEYPAGLEAGRVFGPRLEAIVHYLHLAHPLSYVRVHDLYGLDLAPAFSPSPPAPVYLSCGPQRPAH